MYFYSLVGSCNFKPQVVTKLNFFESDIFNIQIHTNNLLLDPISPFKLIKNNFS